MIGYAYDDGGRRDAGYKGDAGDCVARAFAIALSESSGLPAGDAYKLVYKMMADGNQKRKGVRSARNGVHRSVYDKVAAALGFVKVKLPRGPRPTYTEAYETHGDCVVSTTKHMAAITRGCLRDTFDGRTYVMRDRPAVFETIGDGPTVMIEDERPGGIFERKAMSIYWRPRGPAITPVASGCPPARS